MVAKNHLPTHKDLFKIAHEMAEFPATASEIITTKNLGFGKNTVNFLESFSKISKAAFQNRADFYTRATELAIFMKEEEEQPKETLRSPQG